MEQVLIQTIRQERFGSNLGKRFFKAELAENIRLRLLQSELFQSYNQHQAQSFIRHFNRMKEKIYKTKTFNNIPLNDEVIKSLDLEDAGVCQQLQLEATDLDCLRLHQDMVLSRDNNSILSPDAQERKRRRIDESCVASLVQISVADNSAVVSSASQRSNSSGDSSIQSVVRTFPTIDPNNNIPSSGSSVGSESPINISCSTSKDQNHTILSISQQTTRSKPTSQSEENRWLQKRCEALEAKVEMLQKAIFQLGGDPFAPDLQSIVGLTKQSES
jgi:hypothetical protein